MSDSNSGWNRGMLQLLFLGPFLFAACLYWWAEGAVFGRNSDVLLGRGVNTVTNVGMWIFFIFGPIAALSIIGYQDNWKKKNVFLVSMMVATFFAAIVFVVRLATHFLK